MAEEMDAMTIAAMEALDQFDAVPWLVPRMIITLIRPRRQEKRAGLYRYQSP